MTVGWRAQAACADTPKELFFPGRGESTAPAKQVCATCPVAAACLRYALEAGEAFGIWGGRSEKERRRMRPDVPRLPILTACSVCGDRFDATLRGAKYCSKRCRQRAYVARREGAA